MSPRHLYLIILLLFLFGIPVQKSHASSKKHLVIISICSLKLDMTPGYQSEHQLEKEGGFNYLVNNGALFDGVYASHPYNGLLVSLKKMFQKEKIFTFNNFQFINIGLPIDNISSGDLLKEGASSFSPRHGVNYLDEKLESKLEHIQSLLRSTKLDRSKKAALLVQLKELHYSTNQTKEIPPDEKVTNDRLPYFIYSYPLQAVRRKRSDLKGSSLKSFHSAYQIISSEENIKAWSENPKHVQDVQSIRARYHSKLSALDLSLKKFIEIIHTELGKENTLIMVIGDHGESLMEDGRLGHSFSILPHYTKVPFFLLSSEIGPQRHILGQSLNFEYLRNYIADWTDGRIDTKGLFKKITHDKDRKGFALASCSGMEYGYIKEDRFYIHNLESKKNTVLEKGKNTQDWTNANITEDEVEILKDMQEKYLLFLRELWAANPNHPTDCISNFFNIYPKSIFEL